ncbi:uncharacterized protein LOC127508770 isoform X2 [Ctenopharyngodon idella]|uniref:uncharacterized protein LOC127508770 isoform X2 n=1 Tax=Ctenopharyngodon idella TaxID=7959 RepID=UPI00223246C5|nr:uncharacterized protein LOC127508770 isoform X2 [Ctenopharyngodon idella]XP_051743096.1 uncharacterized protein LOC127508770 isoform X2 [Ctenopharyngodon idella]XP_051743097.1 uncharacterized protein LOC127508770 isoform X2 [Ctenopharyngodon idella]XP_051743098.1 uncharacterized protein LOC127508770 isoform X2 [Ctenopharyngodon idella]XP_051743099.1 uncharacterized protein LOC127508770 isoform X2 [Ctenopharyngodon idella]
MKTIRVDGKPHLCLFATRSINPGEEITYDYGDSEWPWRCMVTRKTQLSSSSEDCAALTVGLDKTLNEVDSSTIEMNTLSQSEFSGVQKVMPEKEQLPMEDQGCAEKVAEKMSPVKEHLVNEEKSSCAPTEVICEDTTGKDQLSLEDQVYAEGVVEKMSPVKEHLVNEEKSFCAPTEGVNEDQLPIEDQVCVQKMSPIKEHLVNEKSFCAPTEVICEDATENDLLSLEDQVCVDKNVEKVCKHDVVTSAISSMDKCAECVGPVAALKWFGLRCKYEISMTDSDASDPDESDSEDDAPAGAAGVSSNADVQKMPIEKVTEVSQENKSEAENPRKGQKVYWSNAEVTAVMKHFKAHITKGKLATLTECKQCKTAEEPVLGKRSAQNIRDFVRNRGISVKRKAQNK